MAYQGGKGRVKGKILPVLNHPLLNWWEYAELGCGMLHIGAFVTNKHSYHFLDLSLRLVTLHRAIQRWGTDILPSFVSKERYMTLKAQDGNDLESAAAAYLYSYEGKEWGGYAPQDNGKCSARSRMAHLETLHQSETFRRATIECASIFDSDLCPTNMLIYVDPPYEGTARYRVNKGAPFDHAAYWERARKWSQDNIVLTSELAAPPDFLSILSYTTRGREEHLFVWARTPWRYMEILYQIVEEVL